MGKFFDSTAIYTIVSIIAATIIFTERISSSTTPDGTDTGVSSLVLGSLAIVLQSCNMTCLGLIFFFLGNNPDGTNTFDDRVIGIHATLMGSMTLLSILSGLKVWSGFSKLRPT